MAEDEYLFFSDLSILSRFYFYLSICKSLTAYTELSILSRFYFYLNAPYSNPPAMNTWSIPYPNITGITTWVENIAYYIAGWGGAILKYVLKYTVALLVNGVSFILNLGMGSLYTVMTTITTEGGKLGILGIPVDRSCLVL